MITSNIRNWRVTVQGNNEPRKVTQQQWDDTHADILAVLLAGIPRTEDMLLRQEAITKLADELTELFYKDSGIV